MSLKLLLFYFLLGFAFAKSSAKFSKELLQRMPIELSIGSL